MIAPRPPRARLALALALVIAAACASGNRSPGTPRLDPPTVLSASRPDWRLPTGAQQGRVLDIQLEVPVDSAGRAEPGAMKLTGLGAAENRDVVVTWLQSVRFRPARQGGRPVAGVYRTRFEVQRQLRRVRA